MPRVGRPGGRKGEGMRKISWVMLAAVVAIAWLASAQEAVPEFDALVDRIGAREQENMKAMRKYVPLVETYIQNMKADPDLGAVPVKDEYFLGRLDMSEGHPTQRSFLPKLGFRQRMWRTLTSAFRLDYLPLGFMQMILLDAEGLDRQHYDFKFVRREFLGDVRCLVVDVVPKRDSGQGRFVGRIWAEDQDYNIVRFNGSYGPAPRGKYYLHFDSWRLNLQPGVWLPAYVYSEESLIEYAFFRKLRFKSQTRLWGYELKSAGRREEFTQILVESPDAVRDKSEAGRDLTPVESQRAWERLAENNVLDRLEAAGLIAPEGEVDKVLQTVVNNLEITNKLNFDPEVRARVLLTAPLESFTVGRTIVVSRGLLDVLPDEATLAAVLAHELAHVALGHQLDTKYAFSDRMIFPDEESFQRMGFRHFGREEADADKKAMELLKNSPYGAPDKMKQAGLFLKAVEARRQALPHLLRAHLGNGLFLKDALRMRDLVPQAPELQPRSLDQIAALPLGARIKLDPWSNRIELVKSPLVPLVAPREKMPFEVTPVFPYVSRKAIESKVAASVIERRQN